MTQSLRDKLRNRALQSTTYPLAVAETSEAEAAVEEARAAHRLAAWRHDEHSDEVAAAKSRLDEAEAELSECYEHVTIKALPAPEFEALADEHPPGKNEDASWNTTTFYPALLAACVNSDMTVDDWAAFLAENATYGDRTGLMNTVLELNARPPEAMVPKGSTTTHS